LPHLPRGAQFAKRALFAHHYWLFGACSRRVGAQTILLLWQDNSCFIEASLDDRQAAEDTQVQKGVEWISQ